MMTEYKTFPKTLDSISGEWCYPKSWFCGRISLDVSSYNNENDWSVVKLAKDMVIRMAIGDIKQMYMIQKV